MSNEKINNSKWETIIEHYKKARKCFWLPKNTKNWHRDDDNGYYHIWTAYHMAKESEEKEHLWYGRILYMMLSEHRFMYSNYKLLHKFAIPMMEEFNLAIEDGDSPTEKEFKTAKRYYDWLIYDEKCHSNEYNGSDKSFQLIENGELLKEFDYIDSVPVHFEHNLDSAILKLKSGETVATFEFSDILEINLSGEPYSNWVEDFFCYPRRIDKDGPNELIFEIDNYKIICKHIKVCHLSGENI